MWRKCLILILLIMAFGGQNTIRACQIPSTEESNEVVSLPQENSIQWEDLGLHDVLSITGSSISAPSSSSRIANRTQSGHSSSRTTHSTTDELQLSALFCVSKLHQSVSLALPTRCADYYIYYLNRLRC